MKIGFVFARYVRRRSWRRRSGSFTRKRRKPDTGYNRKRTSGVGSVYRGGGGIGSEVDVPYVLYRGGSHADISLACMANVCDATVVALLLLLLLPACCAFSVWEESD